MIASGRQQRTEPYSKAKALHPTQEAFGGGRVCVTVPPSHPTDRLKKQDLLK